MDERRVINRREVNGFTNRLAANLARRFGVRLSIVTGLASVVSWYVWNWVIKYRTKLIVSRGTSLATTLVMKAPAQAFTRALNELTKDMEAKPGLYLSCGYKLGTQGTQGALMKILEKTIKEETGVIHAILNKKLGEAQKSLPAPVQHLLKSNSYLELPLASVSGTGQLLIADKTPAKVQQELEPVKITGALTSANPRDVSIVTVDKKEAQGVVKDVFCDYMPGMVNDLVKSKWLGGVVGKPCITKSFGQLCPEVSQDLSVTTRYVVQQTVLEVSNAIDVTAERMKLEFDRMSSETFDVIGIASLVFLVVFVLGMGLGGIRRLKRALFGFRRRRSVRKSRRRRRSPSRRRIKRRSRRRRRRSVRKSRRRRKRSPSRRRIKRRSRRRSVRKSKRRSRRRSKRRSRS